MTDYVIIEDERLACEELKRMMSQLRPDYKLVGWAKSTEQAVLLLRQASPNLIMADIRLADGLCFDIFMQASIDVPVICKNTDYLTRDIEKVTVLVIRYD